MPGLRFPGLFRCDHDGHSRIDRGHRSSCHFWVRNWRRSPVELIPPDDEDEPFCEVDERQARYARIGKLVDVEGIIEVMLSKLRESTQFRWMVEDAIEDPHADVTRPNVLPRAHGRHLHCHGTRKDRTGREDESTG